MHKETVATELTKYGSYFVEKRERRKKATK